jgi:hypothetical protein
VKGNESKLPELRPEDLPLEEIEKRTLMFPKILEIAVKNTQASDWVDFGGKPWLDTPGAERIARVFGFTVKDTRFEKLERSDSDGPYYIYIYYGRVGLSKADLWIDAIGTCSSRKPFHSMEHGRRKNLEDIDETKIIKDAFSNMIENGVTRFLGLRGLEWETLERFGIKREEVSKVEFKTKGTAGATPARDTGPTATVEKEKREKPVQKTQTETHQVRPETPVNPKTRESLIEYALSRVLATREQIEGIIEERFTQKQCNYILTNLAKLQGDVKFETLEDIVRGAVYLGGNP